MWIGPSCSLVADGSVNVWDAHLEMPDSVAADHPEQRAMPLATLIDELMTFEPEVMGILHSKVEAMGPGLEALFERWSGPVMAYLEASPGRPIQADEFAKLCREWVEGGGRSSAVVAGPPLNTFPPRVSHRDFTERPYSDVVSEPSLKVLSPLSAAWG